MPTPLPALLTGLTLLLVHGADRTIADRDGTTALQHARQRGYAAMVSLLSAP